MPGGGVVPACLAARCAEARLPHKTFPAWDSGRVRARSAAVGGSWGGAEAGCGARGPGESPLAVWCRGWDGASEPGVYVGARGPGGGEVARAP